MSDTKQKFIDAVVKGIAELSDRSSPEGHPELMQCTEEEVVYVLLVAYRELIAALEADAARMNWIQSNALCADFEYKHNGYNMPVVCIQWPKNVGVSGNLRASIDAAIKVAK